jgi:hypothetical protein
VLWDQIRYAGDPKEFAWVLPVRAGATIELSNDEFFAALDASTQPTVQAPNYYAGSYGCALTGCGESSADSALSAGGPGSVQVISQSVVGPYEQATLRSTDPDALRKWLQLHDFDIPTSIEPTIKAYVDEGFDFIALRLRPQCSERSMQPVRVKWPGADPTLPLRMVAAGVGANVGITLYVISEGRFHPQNFPDAPFDDNQLRWDRIANKSNYDAISQSIMAQANGHTWLVEYADKPNLYTTRQTSPGYYPPSYYGYGGGNPGLADTYYGQCRTAGSSFPSSSSGSSGTSGSTFTPCPQGSSTDTPPPPPPPFHPPPPPASDGGNDGGLDGAVDDGGLEAGADAGAVDSGAPDSGTGDDDAGSTYTPPSHDTCAYLDDLDVALKGMHASDVWVTRLRAVLPANALSEGDLRLEASKDQSPVSSAHYAAYYTDEDRSSTRSSCAGAPKEHTAFGTWAFAATAAVGLVAFMRRRKR